MQKRFFLSAYDKLKSQPVAVKVASTGMDPRRMKIEQIVLTLLRGKVPILPFQALKSAQSSLSGKD